MRTLQSVASLPNVLQVEAANTNYPSTTLTNDPNIGLAIKRGESWTVRFSLVCVYDVGTGVRLNWTGPTNSGFGHNAELLEPNTLCSSANAGALNSQLVLTGSGQAFGCVNGTATLYAAKQDGTLQLQLGQGKATAGAMQVQQNSYAAWTRFGSLTFGSGL